MIQQTLKQYCFFQVPTRLLSTTAAFKFSRFLPDCDFEIWRYPKPIFGEWLIELVSHIMIDESGNILLDTPSFLTFHFC